MKRTVTVGFSEIAHGVPNDPHRHAVALAVKRAFPGYDVSVGPGVSPGSATVIFRGRGWRYVEFLPRIARNFVCKFNRLDALDRILFRGAPDEARSGALFMGLQPFVFPLQGPLGGVDECVGCGLTKVQEPSVGPRSDALSRCNNCDARRARKQARLEREIKVAFERIDSLVVSVGK